MSNSDFKDYTGNIRLDNISFDVLHQMFENDKEQYDPADDKRNKFYVGKIGKYVDGSYFYNDYWNVGTVVIEFANGYMMTVCEDDVSKTEDCVTLKEFLREIVSDDDDGYKPLTQDEKDFADAAIMQLIVANVRDKNGNRQMSVKSIVDEGIEMALIRTRRYKLRWRLPEE